MLLLCDEPLLVDKFPPSDPHNVGAQILRLGLSVTAFATLERYMEGCFERALSSLSSCQLGYSQFPPELREFLTINAVAGLATRGNFIPEPDRLLYFETHIPALAKYTNAAPTYTAFGFSPRGSNVTVGDLGAGFKALTLKKPWPHLTAISGAAGGSSVDISNDFQNLARTRHRSAHNPQFSLPTSDLQTSIRTAITIGLAVDVLVSVVTNVWILAPNVGAVASGLAAMKFPMRFLDDDIGGQIVERAATMGHVVKRYSSEASALSGAGGRAQKAFIVRRDVGRRPLGLIDRSAGPAAL